MKMFLFVLTAVILSNPVVVQSQAPLPEDQRIGNLISVYEFHNQMPTGVTVSREGRIFVNYPKWGDPVTFTVAEITNGKEVAYPSAEMNAENGPQENRLVSVQSVVTDSQDRLWVLDTGSIKMGPTSAGGPKLVGVDLKSNTVFKKYIFPQDVALPTSYLNDVRFDLHRGSAGYAFITDSSFAGTNAIIVIDLASGKAWRRLAGHPSTKADPNFKPFVEGELLMRREPGKPPQPFAAGSDGIAMSADGKMLFYCPLSSRHLYAVSIDALVDQSKSEDDVAKTVVDLGEKGASDGLESDQQGNLYVTNYETNSIVKRTPDGQYITIVHDPRVLWPDTLAVADDGYLYFNVNQLERQPSMHDGKDLRKKPYTLFKVKIGGSRIQR